MPPHSHVQHAPEASGSDTAGATEAEPPLSLYIDVVETGGDWSSLADAPELVRAAVTVLAAELCLPPSEVCIALSDDVEVAELNGSYRGKPAPTNVLSFPASATIPIADDEPRFLGDVILALETLQREAAELRVPLAHHLQHLTVHGLLHLVGYDHQTDAEVQAMESLETRILARLGIADPYADTDASVPPESPHPEP